MKEIIESGALEKIKNYLGDQLKSHEWKNLFSETGQFLTVNSHAEVSFKQDLSMVFSDENMKNLAEKMLDANGYTLARLLHGQMMNLMIHYELPEIEAETYTNHFIQHVIGYLRENDRIKAMEAFLAEMSIGQEQYYQDIKEKLEEISRILHSLTSREDSYRTIYSIEQKIIRTAKSKKLNLDFFELDDEEFETQFEEHIKENKEDKTIYVVGQSREETLYRILNEINQNYSEKRTHTLIIDNSEDWKRLSEKGLKEYILIPYFYAERTEFIPGNINLFIYSTSEPCYQQEKLELRRRTQRNLLKALERAGFEYRQAYAMLENSNGLYAVLRKRIFYNDEKGLHLPWVLSHSKTVQAAVLCGRWTEHEGDQHIFETLTGKSYSECMEELQQYMGGEHPFLLDDRYGYSKCIRLVSVEDAWNEIRAYFLPDLWRQFKDLTKKAFVGVDTISDSCKEGMVQTLIMQACYFYDLTTQKEVDSLIGQILSNITCLEKWKDIAHYFPDLCEASPEAVLSKLESEERNPSGLKELFSENRNSFFSGGRGYISILWAAEQLIQQKNYVRRVIDWLWKANAYCEKYESGNTPGEVLGLVFCAWLNMSALTPGEKMEEAVRGMSRYENAWKIIVQELPGTWGSKFTTLNSPRYRAFEQGKNAEEEEIIICFRKYLDLCLQHADHISQRWCDILDHLTEYELEKQYEVLRKMEAACTDMNDEGRTDIKEKLRRIIFNNRYYKTADWAVDETIITIYEETLDRIQVMDTVYDFLYLFAMEDDLPILHPIPHELDEQCGEKTKSELQMVQEIQERIDAFKKQNLPVDKMIELAVRRNVKDPYGYTLGKVLATYYCGNHFDETIFELLIQYDLNDYQICEFIKGSHPDEIDMRKIVKTIKEKAGNGKLLTDILALQIVQTIEDGILFTEDDETKRKFWEHGRFLQIAWDADAAVYIRALNECYQHGDLDSYIAQMNYSKSILTQEQLLSFFLKIDSCRHYKTLGTREKYSVQIILEELQKTFMDQEDACLQIAQKEWYLSNVIGWGKMKCTKRIIKKDPALYAYVINFMCRKDTDEKPDEKREEMIMRFGHTYRSMEFCPAEQDGKVNYEELKHWIDQFSELLKKQNQSKICDSVIGKLLANSPIDEDGYYPCEAVRKIIEEYYSSELKRGFVEGTLYPKGFYSRNGEETDQVAAKKYERTATYLKERYPHTAAIYQEIRDEYLLNAKWERERAEDAL